MVKLKNHRKARILKSGGNLQGSKKQQLFLTRRTQRPSFREGRRAKDRIERPTRHVGPWWKTDLDGLRYAATHVEETNIYLAASVPATKAVAKKSCGACWFRGMLVRDTAPGLELT